MDSASVLAVINYPCKMHETHIQQHMINDTLIMSDTKLKSDAVIRVIIMAFITSLLTRILYSKSQVPSGPPDSNKSLV